jgi:hypothetical protein
MKYVIINVKYIIIISNRNSYGMYFHLINLTIYVIFLTFLTINAIKLMDAKCDLIQLNKDNSTNISDIEDEWRRVEVIYEKSSSLETTRVNSL